MAYRLDDSANFIFLLGAGFSQPYGLPVMKEFMERARRTFFTLQDQIERGAEPKKKDTFLQDSYGKLLEFHINASNPHGLLIETGKTSRNYIRKADLLRQRSSDIASDSCGS